MLPRRVDYNIFFYVIEFLILTTLILFVFPHSQCDRDLRKVRKTGVKLTTERAVLFIEKDYLEPGAAEELGARVDQGISAAEDYLGVKLDAKSYGAEKVHFLVKGGGFRSHLCDDCILYRNPYIFLSGTLLKSAPYEREIVKLIARESKAYWLQEGLAVYLNDKLGGWPASPNFGKDVDEKTVELFREGNPLRYIALELFKKIGENREPEFDVGEHDIFATMSASFAKYLDRELGTRSLMVIYASSDPKHALYNMSGKDVEAWKDSWFKSING